VALRFLPREVAFFEMFERTAENIRQASQLLADLLDDYTDVVAKAAAIKAAEEVGDELTYQIILKLNKTFITPIDREDILEIARGMDDITDFLDASAARFVSYRIAHPTAEAREFGRLLRRAGELLVQIAREFRHKNYDRLHEPTVAMNRLENEGDQVLRSAIAGLFDGTHETLDVIKWKEIYEVLETATDKFEECANIIEGVVVKNT